MTYADPGFSYSDPYVVERLPVGRTISETFRIVARNWQALYGLSVAASLLSLPTLILLAEVIAQARTGVRQGLFAEVAALYVTQIIVTLYLYIVATDGSYRAIDTGRFDMRAALGAGVRRYVPALAAAVVFYVMMLVGFVLLVVPGILVGAIYGLAPTLSIVDRCGPFRALARSAALTRGSRWRCFGTTVVLLLIPGVIVAVAGGVAGAVAGPTTKIVAQVALNFLLFPIFYVFPSVMTHELRRLREGGGPRNVADVF